MIRDPSDGTVREEITPEANKINAVAPKTRPEEISGLRAASPKDTYQARYKWSIDWLRTYYERKAASHADGGSDGTECSADGDSSDDQGEA